jgi:hypothetical protein
MKCGNCGNDSAHVEAERIGGGIEGFKTIKLTCTKCKSVTLLDVSLPFIRVEWGEKSDGVFCDGWEGL